MNSSYICCLIAQSTLISWLTFLTLPIRFIVHSKRPIGWQWDSLQTFIKLLYSNDLKRQGIENGVKWVTYCDIRKHEEKFFSLD